MVDDQYGIYEDALADGSAGTFTETDTYSCKSTCGTLSETLTFPVGAPAGLSALVSVASQTLTVAAGVTTAMISENIVTYTASYDLCATSTVDATFTLKVECTTGSDIELTAQASTALTFDFISDTDVTLAFEYTHAYCDPHTVTF